MSSEKSVRILRVDSSARYGNSVSRRLTEKVTDVLRERHPGATVVDRDVAQGVPFATEAFVDATYVPESDWTAAQRQAMLTSDLLVRELLSADYLVVGAPMYNFGVPATLKAYFDQVSRPGVTFSYTAQGPVGLVANVRAAYVVVTSDLEALDSEADSLSGHVRYFLNYLGISNVEIVDATQLRDGGEGKERQAAARVKELLGA